MAGIGIIIARGGATDPEVPTTDLRLAAGSLLLVDPSHSAEPWAAGVPAHGALLPNLAESRAHAAGITGDLRPYFGMAAPDAAYVKVERTAKGGLHVIQSAAQVIPTGQGVNIGIPAAIYAHILANLGHNYFVSSWTRLTRIRSAIDGFTQAPFVHIGATGSDGNNPFIRWTPGGIRPAPGARVLGQRGADSDMNTVGVKHVNQGVTGHSGTAPTDAANAIRTLFRVGRGPTGSTGPGNLASSNTAAGSDSRVLYGFYLEDLTISGRTYADVDALDQQAYNIAFGTGGRYAADTFTDPATVA